MEAPGLQISNLLIRIVAFPASIIALVGSHWLVRCSSKNRDAYEMIGGQKMAYKIRRDITALTFDVPYICLHVKSRKKYSEINNIICI